MMVEAWWCKTKSFKFVKVVSCCSSRYKETSLVHFRDLILPHRCHSIRYDCECSCRSSCVKAEKNRSVNSKRWSYQFLILGKNLLIRNGEWIRDKIHILLVNIPENRPNLVLSQRWVEGIDNKDEFYFRVGHVSVAELNAKEWRDKCIIFSPP